LVIAHPELGSTVDLSDIDLTGASFNSDFAGQATNANQSGDLSTGYILSLTSSLDNYSTSLGDLPFNFTTAGNDITLPPSAFQDLTAPVTFHLDLYAVASPDEALFVYLTLTDGSVINVNGSATAVPEPGTWALLAAGSCGLLIVRRKRSAALPC
jgi:hypothetical protein